MKKLFTTIIVFLILFTFEVSAQDQLEEIFKNPPNMAKPRGYWVWGHGNFDYSTIKKELKAFKEMGLGGMDIFDMGIADPYDIIPAGNPFMGEEMLDGITFALKEAKKLDLKMGFSVSNGWNAGGSWTEPDEMIMQLLIWKDTLKGPVKIDEIGFPKLPVTFKKPYGSFELFPQYGKDGFPEYYQNVGLQAYPLIANNIMDTANVLYFNTDKIDGNKVNIELPEGDWVLTRVVVSPLGQKMWMRSDNSPGFIMDHFSKKATKHHFEHIISKLEERLGDLGESSLERLYLCSFETEDYIIWSPELKKEFFALHGYKPDPFLPVFSGQQVVDKETTERFMHDYRITVSEMFVNNHYKQASEICHEHGLLLASESGGPGPPLHYVPTEDLKALGAVDIMRGEFWNMPLKWEDRLGRNLLQVVKNIASAAHIYGHKIVEMESFTSQTKHWQESPFELKKIADQAFCEGMTRVVYHTMPHSPPEAGVPGWSYQAGTHIHPKMTWWDMSKPLHAYLAKCSAMLMQGNFVADVAFYYGNEIPNFAIGSKYSREGLGAGYDYDDLNTEILLQTDKVVNGNIVLPTGMQYKILVLSDNIKMELNVLRKVEELLQKGATIIGTKPEKVYGLENFRDQEAEMKEIADKIWGNGTKKRKKEYGKGTIITGFTAKEILEEKSYFQDFAYQTSTGEKTLDYIHRSTENAEIYFMRNKDSVTVSANVRFRVDRMEPAFWNPVTGEMSAPAIYNQQTKGMEMPIKLSPYESVFVVFKKEEPKAHINEITYNGNVLFPTITPNEANFSAIFDANGSIEFYAAKEGDYELKMSDGNTERITISKPQKELLIDKSWDVTFPAGWGFHPIQKFEKLIDWTQHENDEIKIFSGKAVYKTTFEFEGLSSNENYYIDLGKVGEVAQIYLNGEEVGISIYPPHRLLINEQLKEGSNHLVVEVANTWLNQLIGESEKPLENQRTRSNLGSSNGKRPWSEYEPLPSGLIGPVKIETVKVNKLTVE